VGKRNQDLYFIDICIYGNIFTDSIALALLSLALFHVRSFDRLLYIRLDILVVPRLSSRFSQLVPCPVFSIA
jgi:hypothetical protein